MIGILRSPARPWARRAFAVALGALLLGGASTSAADDRADRAAAQKLVAEGNRAAADKDLPLALARYQAAYARAPSPKILLSVATTLHVLGRNAEAAAAYEAYLRDPRAERARAAELAEVDALLGHLRIQISEPGAAVQLDGKDLGGPTGGAPVRVDPGEHTVAAAREGFAPAQETFRIASGEERTVSLVLASTRPAPVVVRAPLDPRRVAAYALGGVGAAGLVVGIAAGSMALAQKNQIRGHCFPGTFSCDQAGLDLARSARTWGTASTVALLAGGAVLGAGVVLYLTAPRLAVGVSAGGPTAIVEGSW